MAVIHVIHRFLGNYYGNYQAAPNAPGRQPDGANDADRQRRQYCALICNFLPACCGGTFENCCIR